MGNTQNNTQPESMADKLLDAIDRKGNPCVVGLDPMFERMPRQLVSFDGFLGVSNSFRLFNYAIIDAIHDLVPAVKPQIAFYEKYGPDGLQAFKDTVNYAKSKGLIVIDDAKRGDIGSTSQAYADGHLGKAQTYHGMKPSLDADFLTVNPYFGSDGIAPFVDACREYGKGIFVLVKTSNPSSGELQDRLVELTKEEADELDNLGVRVKNNQTELFNLVGLQVNRHAREIIGKRGYSSIGAVVGATYPLQAEVLRKIMPSSIFLVPGYGEQGAKANDLIGCFNEDRYGAIVNSSRGIIYAYEKNGAPEKFAEAAREAAQRMIDDVCSALNERKAA